MNRLYVFESDFSTDRHDGRPSPRRSAAGEIAGARSRIARAAVSSEPGPSRAAGRRCSSSAIRAIGDFPSDDPDDRPRI